MSVASLIEKLAQHDRLALSRLLSLVARGEHVAGIRQRIDSFPPPIESSSASPPAAHSVPSPCVIAVTGSGGVGKSTLIGKLIEVARARGRTVAVLACDPQSSLTGGALLGDRIRMPSRPDDDGVFIRSLATPAGHSGIAPNIELMARLLTRFGFHIILVETVGSGQGDIAVRDVASVVVVLVQPGTGDELQWEKSGQLEIADVVVVHKADLPGAEQVEAQLRDMLNLPGCRPVPVVRVSASKGQGIEALWDVIEKSVPMYSGAIKPKNSSVLGSD